MRFKSYIKKAAVVISLCTLMTGVISTNRIFSKYETVLAADAVTEIRNAQELVQAATKNTGNIKLMTDIDMKGIEWTPWDFSGTFDGNGHSILNLSVKKTNSTTMLTFDGNRKQYDTYGAGFFGILKDATVTNVNFYGTNVEITTTEHCFAAPIAGLTENAKIKDCKIIDASVSLTDSAIMWGTGGIVGFGNGDLDNVETKVTLICVDTDAKVKDEQFMGGAYGAGFLNIRNCKIDIDGYDSDHGYVHDGGLSGMYMVYPASLVPDFEGEVLNNTVTGRITFFEDNTDRRAYCAPAMGEVMNWTYQYSGFKSDFERNETYDYTVTLKPDMCANPQYKTNVVAPNATQFGYTVNECSGCGYKFNSDYTIHEHQVGTKTPLNDGSNLEMGVCSICNTNVYEMAKPVEAEEAKTEAASSESNTKDTKSSNTWLVVCVVVVIVLIILLAVLRIMMVQKEKKRRARARARAREKRNRMK